MDVLYLLATALLIGAYLWRADFERYSIATVGVFNRVHRYPASAGECVADHCGANIDEGERRVATQEVVVFGCPIRRRGTVVNHYCSAHTSFEYRQGEYRQPTAERVTRSFIAVIVALASFEETITPSDERDPFEDTVGSVGSAFDLAGVAMIICLTVVLTLPFRGAAE